jgi:hypothetical protein
MNRTSLAIAMIITVVVPAVTFGGFGDCKSAGCGNSCTTGSCEPMLRSECKWVDVEKRCWEVECTNVVIPPVRIPKLGDYFRAVCAGKAVGVLPESGSRSCTSCTDASCTGQCNSAQPGSAGRGSSFCACCDNLVQRVFGHHACGRVRTVGKLKSSRSTVKKQVVEWKIVCGSQGCHKCCTSACTTGGCAPSIGY